MAVAEWADFQSPVPVGPGDGENPVLECINLVKSPDGGFLKRRGGIAALATGVTSAVRNHIVTSLGGVPTILVKTESGVFYAQNVGGGWTAVPLESGLGGYTSDRGSFCAFSGEVYYCDAGLIWRWDGGVEAVAPGMPYFDTGQFPPYSSFTFPDPSDDPRWWLSLSSQLTHGGKWGTFAVSWSWYDPIRNIYGPRSKTQVAVIAVAFDNLPLQSFGFKTTIPTPVSGVDVPEHFRVVGWATPYVQIGVRQTATICVDGNCDFSVVLDQYVGEYLSDLVYFEAIGPQPDGASQMTFLKDNAQLARSGQADDAFEPPRPSEHMAILPDGTALYFNPSLSQALGDKRLMVEYSVRHPEQIGRDRDDFPQRRALNGPSVSYLSNFNGTIQATYTVDQQSLLLTDQDIYRLGFSDGSVVVNSLSSGRGVRSPNSITESTFGLTYMSDKGWCAVTRDGESVQLDVLLGCTSLTERMSQTQRRVTAGGSYQNSVFLWMPTFDPYTGSQSGSGNTTAIVFDHVQRFWSQFTTGGVVDVRYGCEAALSDGTRLLLFNGGGDVYRYPQGTTDDGVNFQSKLVVLLNADSGVAKRLDNLTIEYGPVQSAPTVVVEMYENWNLANTGRGYKRHESSSRTAEQCQFARVLYPELKGGKGRYIRITITTSSPGDFEIRRIMAEYTADEPRNKQGSS